MDKARKILIVIFIFILPILTAKYTKAEPSISLPPGQINTKVEYPSSECYYYVVLSNVPDGYHVSNGRFIGWCVDEDHYIVIGKTYSAKLYSSYSPSNPQPDPDWDKVNYILNHKKGSWRDVQDAIWYFVNGGKWPSDPEAKAMINDANSNGEGFIPIPGQIMAVIAYIDENTQIPIIEVCVPIQNVVPEYPIGPFIGAVTLFAALGAYKRRKPNV